MKCSTRRRGFTLIEIMVVVIIIAALAAMVVPRLWPVTDEAKKSIALADEANLSVALKLYRLQNDRFPTSDEGLNALLTAPPSARNWHGPYLERRPLDPWKHEYQYRFPGTHNPQGFDVWSLGPDGQPSADDVGNWED